MRTLQLLVLLLTSVVTESIGQYFQFSQYNFTPLRINPALAGASDFATASLVYRNQGTEGGFHLKSASLNATFPLIKGSNGQRWGGVGVGFMDDRSGNAGIFSRQEASLAYAVNVYINRRQSFSLGVRTLYQTTQINLDHLYTGSQYVTDRGFSESLSNGEGGLEVRNSYFTFAAGLHWQKTDKKRNRLAYAGLSFFDFNNPDDTFFGSSDHLSTTFVGSGGFQLYKKNRLSFNPDMVISYNASGAIFNVGMVTGYTLHNNLKRDVTLSILTRYTAGRHAMIGFQFGDEFYSWGISYDFPVLKENAANTGALEVGFEMHWFKGKRKKKIVTSHGKTRTIKMSTVIATPREQIDTLALSMGEMNMSDRLRNKTDSLLAYAHESGNEQSLILEKAVLHVKFDFNSTNIDEESQKYFDELAVALIDNPDLRVHLVGHTDNVGSDQYNLALSLRRAEAIKDYLVSRGVEEHRIVVEGRGRRESLNENRNDEERAHNRRVEVLILYQEQGD